MLINFHAISVRASSSCGAAQATYPSSERLGVTLVAAEESMIALPDGKDLAELEISFTLFGQGTGLASLKAQFKPGSVGFLSLDWSAGTEPFADGAVAWDHGQVPLYLFQLGVSATFSLELQGMPERSDWEAPFQWLPGKDHRLAIESISIESSLLRR